MSNSKLIVNYIPNHFTNSELYNIFKRVGPVESCHIARDFKSGYSFGYGFVEYTNYADAEKAIRQLNGLQISNKRLKVSFARPPGDNIKDTNLYISNLPKNFFEDDLENLFKVFGTIIQKRILTDNITGEPRGVAFVRFDKRDEAQKAIQHLNGQGLEGSNGPISVRLAEEHGKRRAKNFQKGFETECSHVGLPLNEMGMPPNRFEDPRNRVTRAFGRSLNNCEPGPYQGDLQNETSFGGYGDVLRTPPAIPGSDAIGPSGWRGPWPSRISQKQNRFNPLSI